MSDIPTNVVAPTIPVMRPLDLLRRLDNRAPAISLGILQTILRPNPSEAPQILSDPRGIFTLRATHGSGRRSNSDLTSLTEPCIFRCVTSTRWSECVSTSRLGEQGPVNAREAATWLSSSCENR